MKTDRLYNILSLVGVVATAAFYHWASNMKVIHTTHIIYEGFIERDGYLNLDQTWHILGYLGFAILLLFITFEKQIVKRIPSQYTQKIPYENLAKSDELILASESKVNEK